MGNRYQPRRLSDYIERAYTPDRNQRAAQTMPRKPFIDDNSDDQPMLKRPGVNRILLFPGSFNPPHKGHAELLRYVFEHARDELNIVACIIIMTNEERLEEKTSEEANPLILTRNQRISLWRGAGIPLTRTWIYNKSQAEWAQFRSRLTRNIKRDQIDVKFIILTGPDCIGHTGASDPKQWNCREAITSDVSRATDYRGDNSMRQISAHTPWKKVEVDRYGLSDSIRARLNDKSSAANIEETVSRLITKMDESSACNRYFKPAGKVIFIPCDLTTRRDDPPSSSNIRALVEKTHVDRLREKLGDLVLSPDIFTTFVGERPRLRLRPKVEKAREKTAEEIAAEKAEAWNNIVW